MIRLVSTRDKDGPSCSVSEALLEGLAPDGGLFVPSVMPKRPDDFTLKEGVAYAMYQAIRPFFEGDELENDLLEICQSAFNFPVPMKDLGDGKVLLELIYGPTSAFKDFGARFLAFSMEKLLERRGEEKTILVATSGDTGGAVAAEIGRAHV